MNDIERFQRTTGGFLPGLLGLRFLAVGPEEVRAELSVRRELCTLPGVLHGGTIMAFADTLGAYGTALSLPEGARTTTIESKTNFFAAGVEGRKVIGTAIPLHKGRSTMVWQTRVERDDGRLAALVTQTQIVLPRQREPGEQLAAWFAARSQADQQALMAALERSGGQLYRAWAETTDDESLRTRLLEAAEKEEQNAVLLESLGASETTLTE